MAITAKPGEKANNSRKRKKNRLNPSIAVGNDLNELEVVGGISGPSGNGGVISGSGGGSSDGSGSSRGGGGGSGGGGSGNGGSGDGSDKNTENSTYSSESESDDDGSHGNKDGDGENAESVEDGSASLGDQCNENPEMQTLYKQASEGWSIPRKYFKYKCWKSPATIIYVCQICKPKVDVHCTTSSRTNLQTHLEVRQFFLSIKWLLGVVLKYSLECRRYFFFIFNQRLSTWSHQSHYSHACDFIS